MNGTPGMTEYSIMTCSISDMLISLGNHSDVR